MIEYAHICVFIWKGMGIRERKRRTKKREKRKRRRKIILCAAINHTCMVRNTLKSRRNGI